MASLNYEQLGKNICDAIRMGKKPNPGIKIAEKEFGKAFIQKLLKKKIFDSKFLKKIDQNKIAKLMDFKYGPLIYKAPNGKFKVKPEVGEVLSLSYVNADERCKRIATAVRNECWRRGVIVSMKGSNDTDSKLYFQLTPEDTHVELPQFIVERVKNIDASIGIGDKQDPEWTRGFEKLLLLGAPSGQRLHEILDKKKIRWCGVGFPVKMNRINDYIVSPQKYETVYINSIKETYSKRTKQLCNYYYKALENGNEIHITANDGTDLKFSIKGRPILIDDGIIDDADMARGDVGLNIPSGEAFIAPLEYSANGRIFFDYVNVPGFGHIKKGLWLTFKNGKVVKYETDEKGKKIFKKFLDSNTGEKDRIAELGIGTNMAARFIGTIIVDEKIYGTIHIAIGTNMGAYHGKNKASSHLDMIKQMKGKQGNLTVDGKVVMKNGEPVKKV